MTHLDEVPNEQLREIAKLPSKVDGFSMRDLLLEEQQRVNRVINENVMWPAPLN